MIRRFTGRMDMAASGGGEMILDSREREGQENEIENPTCAIDTWGTRIKFFRADDQDFTNSKSIVIEISSPTITPPLSSKPFQVNPKSLRLIRVVAESPMRRLP